jgi:SAM-dependent methyltransferase
MVTVTVDEVVWCYRTLLGREPESDQTVAEICSSSRNLKSLVEKFVSSEEFQQKVGRRGFMSSDFAEMDVEVKASPTELVQLRRRIRDTWTELGFDRPHHSVLTGDHFLPEFINEGAVEEFYASGITEVAVIESILKRHGFTGAASKSCIEYGCGLGRVTLALAPKFNAVRGYDISATHLGLAKRRAAQSRIGNVDFILCSTETGLDNPVPCDFFYSRLVFQHNPPPLMRTLIASCLGALRPGGIGIFQVPTYAPGYRYRTKEYLASPRATDMEIHFLPQTEIFSLIGEANCKTLEVCEDGSVGNSGQWVSNTFVVRR